jgi:serine/threonine protein kinase
MHIELAEHGSLQRVMEQGQAAPEEFWNPTGKAIIICGIVLGMRFVHSKGYIHGDLKPSNILIKTGGTALISDFGTSRLESADAKSTSDGGSVHYSAPELFLSEGVGTTKSDVFSFGLVSYEILTGSAVFPGSMLVFPVMRKLRSLELPAIPSSCGKLMQDLIHRCWLREPASRPSFDDILNEYQKADFELVPGVDRLKVRQYVVDVLGRE